MGDVEERTRDGTGAGIYLALSPTPLPSQQKKYAESFRFLRIHCG